MCVCVRVKWLGYLLVIMSCSMVSICRGRLHTREPDEKLSSRRSAFVCSCVGTSRSKVPVRCTESTPRGPPGQELAAVWLMKAFAGLNSFLRIAIWVWASSALQVWGKPNVFAFRVSLRSLDVSLAKRWCTFQPDLTVIWFYVILK